MESKEKISGSVEAWESGALGQDERHAILASDEVTRLIVAATSDPKSSARLGSWWLDFNDFFGQYEYREKSCMCRQPCRCIGG